MHRVTKYQKEHIIQFNIKLNKKYDADIIELLNQVPAKSTYIKQLVREDLQRRGRSDNEIKV